ncbi:MAG: hypothetical protein IT423_09920 [Pirellulaceae bacterium]|nr:hypothetical protein [Pirellulaceae bacterium]
MSNHYPQYVYVQEPPQRSGLLSGLMSLFLPGLGQLYKGHLLWAAFWCILTPLGYALMIVPGFILHVLCVYFAITSTPK